MIKRLNTGDHHDEESPPNPGIGIALGSWGSTVLLTIAVVGEPYPVFIDHEEADHSVCVLRTNEPER
jgi:hypothetical protein